MQCELLNPKNETWNMSMKQEPWTMKHEAWKKDQKECSLVIWNAKHKILRRKHGTQDMKYVNLMHEAWNVKATFKHEAWNKKHDEALHTKLYKNMENEAWSIKHETRRTNHET